MKKTKKDKRALKKAEWLDEYCAGRACKDCIFGGKCIESPGALKNIKKENQLLKELLLKKGILIL